MRDRTGGMWPWLLQRITAVLLVGGLAVHFTATHFAVERPLTFEVVRERLLSPAWVWFDLLLLGLALYHGLNGLHGVLLDHGIGPAVRRGSAWTLGALGVATFIVGAWILAPFAEVLP